MSFFKKAFFGLVMMLLLVMGVSSIADASFTKQIVGGTQYQNNGLVQYVVSYTNTGTADETIRLVDVLPASLMAMPGATALCDGVATPGSVFTVGMAGNTYTTNFCTLQPGENATITISAFIVSQDFSTISNIANVEYYSGGVFVSSDSAMAGFSSYPVLSIDKILTGLAPQELNDLVTFHIVVTNSGASAANNIVVTDSIPNGFEYDSSTLGTPTLDIPNNTATWTIPTIPANTSVTYTVVIRLATSIPGAGLSIGSVVTNTGTLSTGALSTGYLEFISSMDGADFSIAGIPSVTLIKDLVSPSNNTIAFSGDVVGYAITITNTGTDIAMGSIIDILPVELTGFTSSIAPSSTNGYTWIWTGLSINPNSSLTIYLTGILANTYTSNSIFTNTANFSYSGLQGPLVNDGVATGLILGLPNVELQKSLLQSASPGISGNVVVYSLTVTNTSPTLYTGNRCITDTFPTNVTLLSSSIAQSPCGTPGANQITFSGTGLPATIILTGVLNTTLSSGTVVTNDATVTVYNPELLTSDNTDSVSFTISQADVSISKAVSSSVYTGMPGTPILYTITYANNGGSLASGVVITDTLSSSLVYSGMVNGPTPVLSGQTLTRTIPSLTAGQTGSLSFYALLSGYVQGTVTNTGTIALSGTNEANLINNNSSVSFTVVPSLVDLSITKTLQTAGTYMSGSQYTFLLTLANNGGQTATGVTIADLFPSVLSYVSGSTSLLNTNGQPLTWTVAGNTISSDSLVLSPGATGSVLITMQLNTTILTGTTYTNTGFVATSSQETLLTNNTDGLDFTVLPPVFACSGLNYSISVVSPLQNPMGLTTLNGQSLQYTYSLTNNYGIPLEVVSINTTWPSQVSNPAGLVGGVVASNIILPSGSGTSYTLSGTTLVDGISTLTTPASFTVRVPGGQPFTCTTASTLSLSQTCGNGFINTNIGEQCENYNGGVVVGAGQTFDPNSQICNSSCRIQTTRVVNCATMTVNGVQETSCVPLDIDEPQQPSSCGNGIKDSNEQCDLGSLPGRIGNYLDNSTAYPSYPHRNKICNQYCQIEESQASRCGDGILGPLEQCDMGENGGTIGSHLNTNGQLFPAGAYQNKSCTSSCVIDGDGAPQIPACWYTDSVISVMKDEYLPLAWELELGKGNIVQTANQCNNGNEGALIEDTVECEFHLYGPGDESAGRPPRVVKRYGNGCDTQNRHDNKYELFNDFSGPDADPLFVKEPRGTDYIKLDNSIIKNTFGEYKISLARVDYQYCRNGSAVSGNPYARVCQIDVAVTDHYLMQKGSVSQLTNTDLSRYFMIGGESLYSYTQLDKIDKISNLNYANISSSLNSYTNALTTKYDKIAVSAKLGSVDLKKVPGKSIYIVNGNANFDALDTLSAPTTIIVKGDATIQGDIKSNVLLIAKGKVKFNIKKDNTWANGCNTQTIRGIIIAQGGFLATDNDGYENDDLDSHVRCRKGNLHVYGVLVGNNLDDVVESRRSHLEHWFTFERNGVNFNGPTDEKLKAERRDEVYKGASVYIEQNPSLWRSMPPEADEFLQKLNISRN